MAESQSFVAFLLFRLSKDTDIFVGRLMNRPHSLTLFLSCSTEFVADYLMQVISSSIVKWEGEEQPLEWSLPV